MLSRIVQKLHCSVVVCVVLAVADVPLRMPYTDHCDGVTLHWSLCC
jgi:hypothetical protein